MRATLCKWHRPLDPCGELGKISGAARAALLILCTRPSGLFCGQASRPAIRRLQFWAEARPHFCGQRTKDRERERAFAKYANYDARPHLGRPRVGGLEEALLCLVCEPLCGANGDGIAVPPTKVILRLGGSGEWKCEIAMETHFSPESGVAPPVESIAGALRPDHNRPQYRQLREFSRWPKAGPKTEGSAHL